MNEKEREAAGARRRIIRKAQLYTWGLFALLVFVTLGGAALIALFVRLPGMGFVKRWLLLSVLVIVPAMILFLIQRYRENRDAARGPDSGGQ